MLMTFSPLPPHYFILITCKASLLFFRSISDTTASPFSLVLPFLFLIPLETHEKTDRETTFSLYPPAIFLLPSLPPSTSPEGWTLINVTSHQAEQHLWSRQTQKEREKERAEGADRVSPASPNLRIKPHQRGGKQRRAG